MTTTTALAGLLGLGTGLGLLLVAAGLRRTEPADDEGELPSLPGLVVAARRLGRRRLLFAAAIAGTVVGAVTGWPVGGLLTCVAVLLVPQAVAPERGARQRTARIEAVAVWAEMLRDTLQAAAGLEQALLATAASPPAALAGEVRALAARLEAGERTADALRAFADDVDDPTADLVVASLVLAADRHARHLAALLGTLAEAARDQVVMRVTVDAERARVRTSVRVIIGVTLAMAAGLVLLNRSYVAPFDTAGGQVALLAVGGLFTASFAWMARIARLDRDPRLLTTSTTAAAAGRPPEVRP